MHTEYAINPLQYRCNIYGYGDDSISSSLRRRISAVVVVVLNCDLMILSRFGFFSNLNGVVECYL